MKKKQSVLYGGIGKNGKTFVTSEFEYAVAIGLDDPKPLNRKSKRTIFHEYRKIEKESSAEFLDEVAKKKKTHAISRKKIKAAGYLRRRAQNKRK